MRLAVGILTSSGHEQTKRALLIRKEASCPNKYAFAGLSPARRPLIRSCSFILNGLANANQILGEEVFKLEDWRAIGEYVYDEQGGRHQAFYSPVKDVVVFGETVKAGQRIQVEQSLKYSELEAKKLWNTASLKEVDQWLLGQEYGEYTSFAILFITTTPGSCDVTFSRPRLYTVSHAAAAMLRDSCCVRQPHTVHPSSQLKRLPCDHSTFSYWAPSPPILV